jgi:DNA-binding response OmpR family regulator
MKKIIFVDDDPGICDVAKIVFEKAGYDITIFSNGAPLLKNDYALPDIIILDKQLPDIDGVELCRKLKKQERTKNVSVIMLSANHNIKTLAKNAGADEVMEKPFSLQDLRKMVAKYTD